MLPHFYVFCHDPLHVDFMTYSIARAIYTHDHDLHDLPPSHGGSFADVVQCKGVKRVVKVKELRNSEQVDGAAVAIPIEAVEEVSSRAFGALGYCDSLSNGKGYSLAMVDIEYEWKPPRCSTCAIFDHVPEKCPKNPTVEVAPKEKDDGFVEVTRKKHKAKQNSKAKHIDGLRLNKPSLTLLSKCENGETSKVKFMPDSNYGIKETDWEDDRDKITVINDSGKFRTNDERAFMRNQGLRMLRIMLMILPGQALLVLMTGRVQCPCDFNAALFLHDSSAGNSKVDISMHEFKDCIEEIEVIDVQHSGLQFTWSQKPKGRDGLLKKIDRIMANLAFNDNFAGAHAMFKPYRISDHAPSILIIPTLTKPKPKPFKFYNIITCNDNFAQVVKEGWSRQVSGFHMFRVAQRLKSLKKPLRKLLYDKGNLHTNVNLLRDQLDRVQMRLDMDPFNEAIRDEEANIVATFNEACLLEERFLKQKAKIDCDGMVFENENVATAFVSQYEAFLGQPGTTCGLNDNDLFRVILDQNVAIDMIRNVTRQEVSLKVLVILNTDGILSRGEKHQKAYDTVDWDFLKKILAGFGFHTRMIGWIMECVTTTSFSISINGSLHGFFKGKRGLRQGDPLSPYLFTLIMEVLTLMLQRGVQNASSFTYHRYCSKLELINLCFADDLFLFAHGDVDSAKIIKDALFEFKEVSGLVLSLPKSTTYFCNVLNHTKIAILQILPFEEGRLPVKYLGVPLVSSCLVFRDCKELIEKVQARVDD
ncbi:putative reverse transcriptase domain, reverse transcriptase zinc-binding domain protein [Tanacetum coccineum]